MRGLAGAKLLDELEGHRLACRVCPKCQEPAPKLPLNGKTSGFSQKDIAGCSHDFVFLQSSTVREIRLFANHTQTQQGTAKRGGAGFDVLEEVGSCFSEVAGKIAGRMMLFCVIHVLVMLKNYALFGFP